MYGKANISIISRTDYNRLTNEQKLNNVYFISEGENSVISSMCVGNAKKCDVVDISETYNISINDPRNPYNIPETAMIKDKLIMYKQAIPIDFEDNTDIVKEIYRVVVWDGVTFKDIASLDNNVIICPELPQTGIENYVYIETKNNGIYVYSNSQYIPIITRYEYATVKSVNEMYNRVLAILKEKFGYLPDIDTTQQSAGE